MKLIPLTQGLSAEVDDRDFDWLSQWKWCVSRSGNRAYAVRRVTGTKALIRMHREIFRRHSGEPMPKDVDHADCNGLHNCFSNLRAATRTQNNWNARKRCGSVSQFKGVDFCAFTGRWRAKIKIEKKTVHLGRFDAEELAARAYDEAAKKLRGEFARLNFT